MQRSCLAVIAIVGLPSLATAQDIAPQTAIISAFEECQNWVETGDLIVAAHWHAIVKDEPFQDRRVSILISDQVPLYLLVDATTEQSDVVKRSCAIRLADTAQPVFQWVNGTISTQAFWGDLVDLPPDLVAQQLDRLRTDLTAAPDFARVGDANKANAMFASCAGESALAFTVYPEWRLAGFGGWEVRGFYDAAPALPGSQVQLACDARQ